MVGVIHDVLQPTVGGCVRCCLYDDARNIAAMNGDTYVPRRPPELPRSSRYDTPQRRRTRHTGPPRRARKPQWVYWVRRAGALLIIFLLLLALVRACGGQADPETAAPETATETVPSETATVTTPASATTEAAPPPDFIETSRPVEMVIPTVNMTAKFETDDCRVVDGKVDPGGLSKACAYVAPDRPYELPGTNAGDIVVIAGHAAAGVPAVFDKLYSPSDNAHTVNIGDTLYVRTEASGEWWLKYVATDLHDPMKDALATDTDVWGSGPMPGRLVTISCVQPVNPFEDSVRNAVVGWAFEGVTASPGE